MAKEKRLIDANAIKYRKKGEYCGNGNSRPVRYVYDVDIAEMPTVDAVEVVRCKDCKYLENGNRCYAPLGIGLCDDQGSIYVKPDEFCSSGERRAADENL